MSGGGLTSSFGQIGRGEATEPLSNPLMPFSQIAQITNPEKPNKAKKPPPPPTIADKAVGEAIQEELQRLRRRRGFGSTILTSPLGDTSSPILQKKSLLGA